MRSTLPTVGRRAGLCLAAGLVSLTTACGPGALGLGAAAAPSTARLATAGDEAPAHHAGTTREPTPSGAASSALPNGQPAGTGGAGAATDVPTPSSARQAPTTVAPQPAPSPRGATARSSARSGTHTSTTSAGTASGAGTAAGTSGGSRTGTTTGGSGGAYTDQPLRSYTAANGLTGQYLLYAGGVDASRPVGLIVYVDGSGEYGIDHPASSYALGGSTGLIATGKARNMITLAVKSPNQACKCWDEGNTSGYADFLANLVETQLGHYPVADVWLAGFSSGAQEVTRFLVPRHPELMRSGGGWVVFGGGGPPDASTSLTAAQMAGVRGYWYTGTADTSVPLTASWGAKAGESWYAAHGVTTSHEWPQGVGHGLHGLLGQTVGRIIDGR